jgi:glycosyltransferase involved in cell wall biosynthesis
MGRLLSVFIITKNSANYLRAALKSVSTIASEIIVVDDYSTDSTLAIALEYGAKIYLRPEQGFGEQKAYALSKTTSDWVLELDSDEYLTRGAQQEIVRILAQKRINCTGFELPYQTFLFGQPLHYGGENYQKLILFNKKYGQVSSDPIHDRIIIKQGQVGQLKNKVYHYSYRSLGQVWQKFTRYAWSDYQEKKQQGERSSWKKIFLFPLHMFWARFIKDQGYKDGGWRFILDLGFAYMEGLTYWLLAIFPPRKK